jgi:uncharacterized protein with von Willebrand factor type A (vWA) domain
MKNSLQKPLGASVKSTYEEEERKLRSQYLEHPDRKQFFSYDFAEAFWMHMLEYYGKTVGDDAIEDMKYTLLEDDRIWQMVYDTVEQYADERGWKTIV